MAAKKATKKKALRKGAKKTVSRAKTTKKATKKKAVRKALPVMPATTHHSRARNSNVYRPTRAIAIVALIINLLLPGLGTIIGGRTRSGVWQIIMLCVGLLLLVVLIGVPLLVGAWIWALISSILIMQESI